MKINVFKFFAAMWGLVAAVGCSCQKFDVEATEVLLDKTSLELQVGEFYRLTATVLPDDATNKTLTWETNDSNVALVVDGEVIAKAEGLAVITAKCGRVAASCAVSVKKTTSGFIEAKSITLNHTSATLGVGETLALTATVLPDNATDKKVSWTSSDPAVATVSNGKVTAVAIGSATITASCGSARAECVITVSPVEADAITLDQTSVSILVGESLQLTASVSPDNVTDKTVYWASSNPGVATVNEGKVTAVSVGSATITAICGNVSAICAVTVYADGEVSLYLDPVSALIEVGEVLHIEATVVPEGAPGGFILWASSNSKVASVDSDGNVTGLSSGTATIVAQFGKAMATCIVNVAPSKVVPPSIRNDIENWMPVYDGVNPPNVEGTYYIDPFVAVYCEDQGFDPGYQFASIYIQFMNQTAYNTLDYREVSTSGRSQSSGIGVFISGEGDNFTVYFDTVGTAYDIYTKEALIISGTKTPQGIKNLYYALVMVEKGPDPNHLLMDEGVFRVGKDQDGLSVNATWPSYAKLSAGTQPGLALPLMRDVRR